MIALSSIRDRVDARSFLVTIFRSVTATRAETLEMSLPELFEKIRETTASEKSDLPLLKLASFGNRRTSKGSIRHDANVEQISGVEVEHDAGEVAFHAAVEKLRAAGLKFLAYTTPSHTPERPRWRVLAPCSRPLSADKRSGLVARMNGILDGCLSIESFALSQIYYFGRLEGAADHEAELNRSGFAGGSNS